MKSIFLILALVLAVPAWAQDPGGNAETDTLGSSPYHSETVVVSAPPVTVDEVIEAIARRMERDNALMTDYEYTTLITQVLRDKPGVESNDYKIEEFALRHHFSRELGSQVAKLWERSREFENGQQIEDKVDEEMTAEFLPVQDSVIEAMPFSSHGGHRYNYNILDRQLVGNNLIYKIGFEPKNKFEAMPKGTIWVDYSNWVIRKFEAEMTDVVPYPLFMKSVPVYRMSQERFGEVWFPTEVYMHFILRDVPFVPLPENVEVRVSLRDIVINGESLSPEDTAPGSGVSEFSAEEIAEGFWLSEEASNDSLTTYWNRMGEDWEADLSPETIPVTLAQTKIDSLTGVGSSRLQDLRQGNLWRVKPDFFVPPGYNRTQGFVARMGLTIEKQGRNNPNLDLVAGYAFANQLPVYSGELALPLVRSRWKLKDQPADGRQYRGSRYEALSLRLAGRRDSGLFAGDGRRHTRSASSFLYGSDPNHYFEDRGIDGELKWQLSRELVLHAGAGYAEHHPWQQRTRWNVLGRTLRPDGNLPADYLNDGFVRAGGVWQGGPLQLDGEVTWHDFRNTPVLGGETTMREVKISGQLDLLDRFGNQWLVRGAHRGFDGSPPVQWKSWLGDYGTLRGYNAGELTGDSGAHASLDARFSFDLFRAAKVPVLKSWRLQPIGFLDWGKTWDVGEKAVGPEDPTQGARAWRMDIGFGFGKRFDVPGLGKFPNLRVYAAHPVGEGSDGNGWRVLLGFEK
jgi:hypothetical protein